MKKILPVGIILLMLLGIPLSFSVYESSQINPSVRDEAQEFFGEDLIDVRKSQGDLNVFLAGNVSESEFEGRFEDNMVEVIPLEKK